MFHAYHVLWEPEIEENQQKIVFKCFIEHLFIYQLEVSFMLKKNVSIEQWISKSVTTQNNVAKNWQCNCVRNSTRC